MMFTNVIERSPVVVWRSIFENARRMKGMLLRVLHIVSDGLTPEHCIAAHLLSQKICHLRRKSGLLFTALYLKQCSVVLQKYYGEGNFSAVLLTPQVSLTRCGLPTIIPSYHRKMIRMRNDKSDMLVRVYLSWFSLARVVLLAPKVTKETFESLHTRLTNMPKVASYIHSLQGEIVRVIERYLPHRTTIPVNQGLVWAPTWKSTPNQSYDKKGKKVPSLYNSLYKELETYHTHFAKLRYGADDPGRVSILNLIPSYTIYAGDFRQLSAHNGLAMALLRPRDYGVMLNKLLYYSIVPTIGTAMYRVSKPTFTIARVAASMAGAGKRRLFIIGNYIVQRLLKPYHDWFMTILRSLPCDGTYDQQQPIRRVMGHRFVASYDLKSATDRWPRHFMAVVACNLFGFTIAAQLVEFGLGVAPTVVNKPLVSKASFLSFEVGTPLGYYSAWPLFALSHHILVWIAAEAVYPGRVFTAYGILGDDLVIADRKVAERYTKMIDLFEVKISLQKSLISDRGSFEFAKKFYILNSKGVPYNASAVSIRALLLARTTLGLSTIKSSYGVPLAPLLRIAGAGYRVMSKLSPLNLKGRWLRLIIFLSFSPGFTETAFEWWLSGWKQPINPYLKGRLFWWLLSKTRPKQITLPKRDDFRDGNVYDYMIEFTEYTITREWLRQWLNHLHWHATRHGECSGTLTDLLKAPVVETSWRRRAESQYAPTGFRYGVVWRLYDLAEKERNSSTAYPILAERRRCEEQLQFSVIWRLQGG